VAVGMQLQDGGSALHTARRRDDAVISRSRFELNDLGSTTRLFANGRASISSLDQSPRLEASARTVRCLDERARW
jgi:hypothetical protein